jgi:hypothetical protein
MAFPRIVKATEVLAERDAARKVDPGHSGGGFYGFMPVCHCANCRDHYDPTGEEVAAYLNCQSSFFDKLAYLPEFGQSELYTYSFYNNRKPGIYLQGLPGSAMLFSSPLKAVRNAVLSENPSPHLVKLYENKVEDHFYLNARGKYERFTYVKGQLFIYMDSSDKEISPDKVLSKMTVLNPEDEFDWEEQDFIPLESGPKRCDGCEYGHLNQLGHMGPGGCLEENYEAYCMNCGHIIPGMTEAEFTFDENIYVCEACEA